MNSLLTNNVRNQKKQTILVAGATGKTGGPLVQQALAQGHDVRVIVRCRTRLPAAVLEHPKLTILEASILELSDGQLADSVKGCDAVVSCLGHVISFRGIFGAPRKLCTEAAQRLCQAIEANKPASPVRFILMNTVGVANSEQGERRTWSEKGVLTLLRWCIPPHVDNELAAQHLQGTVGSSNDYVQWCSVRPDTLIDDKVSSYDVVASPVTGLFSGRPTTRANVAHFMLQLVDNDDLWGTWKYKMPVIMNTVDLEKV